MTTRFSTQTEAQKALDAALARGRAVVGYTHSPNGCDWYAHATSPLGVRFCLTRGVS